MPPEGIDQAGPEADDSYHKHLCQHFFSSEILSSVRLLYTWCLKEGCCNSYQNTLIDCSLMDQSVSKPHRLYRIGGGKVCAGPTILAPR